VEGAAHASNRRETKDLHRTPVIRLVVLFHAFTVKRGFKSWVVGLQDTRYNKYTEHK
jgi:hypothetical protein